MAETFYRQIYFEAIDNALSTIQSRFDQPGFQMTSSKLFTSTPAAFINEDSSILCFGKDVADSFRARRNSQWIDWDFFSSARNVTAIVSSVRESAAEIICNECVEEELTAVTSFYGDDLDATQLEVQL